MQVFVCKTGNKGRIYVHATESGLRLLATTGMALPLHEYAKDAAALDIRVQALFEGYDTPLLKQRSKTSDALRTNLLALLRDYTTFESVEVFPW